MSEEKVCKKCGVSKPVSDFYPIKAAKSGSDLCCRPCRGAYQAERRKRRKPLEQPVRVNTKVCRTCQVDLPVAAFSLEKMTRDGIKDNCKACLNIRQRELLAGSPEKREEERIRKQRYRAVLREQREVPIAEGLMVRPRRGPRPRVPLVPQAPEG